MSDLRAAYAGKRVLVTGHTGFKGAWLSLWLEALGAKVSGFALEPETEPNIFSLAKLADRMDSRILDLRDADGVAALVADVKPEMIFHLAAQPLVRRSYADPVGTFAVNVSGTAHLLEAARATDSVKTIVAITTDKVYAQDESGRPFKESDPLGGHDPYSSSKAAMEIVCESYRKSFFAEKGVGLTTVRAGNVIGGGDWSEDRIVPDCVRALAKGEPVGLRNPGAIRPWQHVLEPLSGYLAVGARLAADPAGFAEAWNFGPDDASHVTVGELVGHVLEAWGGGASDERPEAGAPHEAGLLKLDSSKARERLGWKPAWGVAAAAKATVEWHKAQLEAGASFDAAAFSLKQIEDYAA